MGAHEASLESLGWVGTLGYGLKLQNFLFSQGSLNPAFQIFQQDQAYPDDLG